MNTEREQLLELAKRVCHGQPGQLSDLVDAILAAGFRSPAVSEAPGHTDLMVTPESLDKFLEANPLPAASEDDAKAAQRLIDSGGIDGPDVDEIAAALAAVRAEARREADRLRAAARACFKRWHETPRDSPLTRIDVEMVELSEALASEASEASIIEKLIHENATCASALMIARDARHRAEAELAALKGKDKS
jgi:hypothetical protein